MITTNYCNVSAEFDSGTFMYFGVSAPLREHQFCNSIQDEYNLSFGDFIGFFIGLSFAGALIYALLEWYMEDMK